MAKAKYTKTTTVRRVRKTGGNTVDYTIRDDSRFGALTNPQNDFSLKNEVDIIKKDIEALKERVGSMAEKEGEK